ncbi:winged helix-turn-helix domain-containing protein [Streptomyces sp. NPDC016459]|uniref:winged helix-turn-helix domain-containing protein n=1 Tax=Streptomyces sp. NPDC016459 TaxID=3157190 RepID=UPI0033C3FC36
MTGREAPASGRELKFRALMAEPRRGILDGTWPPGSRLPTERALATETGLSVTTVRRAYEDLVAPGLVARTDAPTAAPVESGFARAVTDLGLSGAPAYERDVMARWDPDRADLALAGLRDAGVTRRPAEGEAGPAAPGPTAPPALVRASCGGVRGTDRARPTVVEATRILRP